MFSSSVFRFHIGEPCSSNALSNTNQLNNSSESTDNVPDNEIERRRCAYQSQLKIKDELRKAQQGMSCGANIDKLFNELEEQNELGASQTLRTLKADGQTLEQMTRLSITELDRMRNETAKSLDPELFVVRLKNFANQNFDNGNENIFITLGRQYGWLLRCVPDFDYEKQPIPNKKPRQNARRVIKKKIKLEQQEIVAKSLRELHEEEKESTSVSKELDNVKKHLRRLFKEQKSDKIDYYKFVLNPNERTGFGDTIENMFYVSFLIRDGSIGLKINEQGVPTIVKISREEREQQIQRNEFDTTQVIGRLDYSTWKKLVQKLGITEAFITRKTVEKRDPIEENEQE